MSDIIQNILDSEQSIQKLTIDDVSCNQDLSYSIQMFKNGCTGMTNNIIYIESTESIGPIGLTGPIEPIGLTGPVEQIESTEPIRSTEPKEITKISLIHAKRPNITRDISLLKQHYITSENNDIWCTFINAYSIIEQTIKYNKPVVFDTHSALCGCCFHEPKSGNIWIYDSGYYYITININTVESAQFSLVKNELSIIPGTTIGTISRMSNNTMNTIIHISEYDITEKLFNSKNGNACKLQLINNTNNTPYITLYGSESAKYIIPQNTASITIIKI